MIHTHSDSLSLSRSVALPRIFFIVTTCSSLKSPIVQKTEKAIKTNKNQNTQNKLKTMIPRERERERNDMGTTIVKWIARTHIHTQTRTNETKIEWKCVLLYRGSPRWLPTNDFFFETIFAETKQNRIKNKNPKSLELHAWEPKRSTGEWRLRRVEVLSLFLSLSCFEWSARGERKVKSAKGGQFIIVVDSSQNKFS